MSTPASQAAAIFSQGPETLVAASRAIAAGPPTHVVKQVQQATTGSEAVPVEWTISGEIANPAWLKGAPAPGAAAPLPFVRRERAVFAMPDPATPDWELELGSVEHAAAVVLLYAAAQGPARILPSPAAGPDVVQLVSDLARIQAIDDEAARLRAWSEYATSAPWVEGRKAALRSLAGSRASWPMVQPTWLKVLHTPSAPPEARIFAFLLLAHLAAEQRWPHSLSGMVALAIDAFAGETKGPVALGFTDGLLLLHAAAARDPQRFPGVARAVVSGLRQRETLVPATDAQGRALNEAYQQLRGPLLAPVMQPEK